MQYQDNNLTMGKWPIVFTFQSTKDSFISSQQRIVIIKRISYFNFDAII